MGITDRISARDGHDGLCDYNLGVQPERNRVQCDPADSMLFSAYNLSALPGGKHGGSMEQKAHNADRGSAGSLRYAGCVCAAFREGSGDLASVCDQLPAEPYERLPGTCLLCCGQYAGAKGTLCPGRRPAGIRRSCDIHPGACTGRTAAGIRRAGNGADRRPGNLCHCFPGITFSYPDSGG